MTFPTTPILDNFNRANENPLAGNWIPNENTLQLISNQAAATVALPGHSISHWTTAMGPNVEAYVDVTTLDDYIGLYARLDPAAGVNNYAAFYTPNGPSWELYGVNGVLLGIRSTPTLANGDAIGIRCFGRVIQAWGRVSGAWSPFLSAIDTQNDGTGDNNRLALDIYGTTARVDNFGGGPASADSQISGPERFITR